MSEKDPDVIDRLVGIERGSRFDAVRAARPEARANAQKSYEALFETDFPAGVTSEERYTIAAFVAGLHREPKVLGFYMDGLVRSASASLVEAIGDEIRRGAAEGPYGRYPLGPLTLEDKAGPTHRVSAANRKTLGARVSAALEHAHLLVFHPRDASPAALRSLLDAGWSTTDIVTLSQLVAFLSFQIRVVTGLGAIAARRASSACAGESR
jgi:CMD domain protein